MIRTSFRTILLVVAGALTTQGVFAQTPGIPQHEAIHMSAPTGGASAISGGGSANPGTGSGVPVAIPAKKYDALLARERETLGQVVDVHNDFYPSDEFLHILASPGRKPLISAPFNAKSKAEAVGSFEFPTSELISLFKDLPIGNKTPWSKIPAFSAREAMASFAKLKNTRQIHPKDDLKSASPIPMRSL